MYLCAQNDLCHVAVFVLNHFWLTLNYKITFASQAQDMIGPAEIKIGANNKSRLIKII